MKFAFLIASIVAICYAQVPLSPNGDFRATIATATTTATASSGATTLTVASATGIKVYQAVSGTGIAAGTQVTAVSGTSITIFPGTTASLSAGSVTFGGLPVASSSKFLKVLAIDGLTACDTSTGGGTYQVILVSSGSAWTAPNCGGSGGGSAGANVSIAYAATISPTCASSSTGTLTTFIVGALTGAITINNPSTCTPGQSIGFYLLQDATGGRVVTFGASYLYAPALPTAANSYAYYEFKYDGASWNNTVARGLTCTPYTAGALIAMGSAGCPETANANEASYPFIGTGAGTANAQTITLNSSGTAFSYPTSGSKGPFLVWAIAGATNTSTTPTVNVNALGALTYTKCGGSAVAASDTVSGTPMIYSIQYNSGVTASLVNPATGCGGGGSSYPPITGGTAYQFEDFTVLGNSNLGPGALPGPIGRLQWTGQANTGNTTLALLAGTSTTLGGISVTTDGTTGHDANIFYPGLGTVHPLIFNTGQTFTMRFSIIGVTSDSKTGYRLGLSDSAQIIAALVDGGGQAGIWIEKNNDAASGGADTGWFAYCGTAASTYSRSAAQLAAVSAGSQIAFQISNVSGTVKFRTASTIAGLASASDVTVVDTTKCTAFAAGTGMGAAASTSAAKTLKAYFWDYQVSGLSQ